MRTPDRKPRLGPWAAGLWALLAAGCQGGPDRGTLHLLTYNVAGLPQGLSHANPEVNIPLISPRLNAFDHVNVQEDFYYQDELRAQVTLPHQSEPQRQGSPSGFGDGLNRFSRFPWRDFVRVPYSACNGADCGAHKGLSVALTELADGVEVDIYNTHLNAGASAADEAARRSQVQTLLSTLTTRSRGRAVLLAGDFNLARADGAEDVALLERLRQEGGLTLVCDALQCGEDRVDRIFFRGSAELSFTPLERQVEQGFRDAQGQELSDHEPLSARLRWRRR